MSYQDLPRTVIHPGEDAYKKEGAADAEFTKHNAPITGISAIKDDLFSAAKDGAIYRWSIKDQEVVSTYSVRGSPVTMLLLRTRLSVDYTVRDTVWAGFENGKVQRWDIESCDAVPGGDIAESGGPAVVNGVARQGHVYWADNEGVHDTDVSRLAQKPQTTSNYLPHGVKVKGLSHKSKRVFAVGEASHL